MTDHYRKLENMYRAAPVNAHYSPTLEVSEGRAVITMNVDPGFFHAANALHGSVYFKALDDAAFFAVNSLVEDVFVLTVTFNLQLLRPISEGRMIATGRVVNAGRTVWVADATLVDDRDRLLARGTGSFMRSKVALSEIASYSEG
jgi:uncharacterized protein (TIGR00369 family)